MANSWGSTCSTRSSSDNRTDLAVWMTLSTSSWVTSSSEMGTMPVSLRQSMFAGQPQIDGTDLAVCHHLGLFHRAAQGLDHGVEVIDPPFPSREKRGCPCR